MKLPGTHEFTKDEIRNQISMLKERGWIELTKNRSGRDGGLGNSLEDYLQIKENNLPIADLGIYELKTHRKSSGSLISLFRQEPGPGARDKILPYLIENYGWDISKCPLKIKTNICMHDPNGTLDRCYPPGEKSLRVDMDGKDYAERGFKIEINRELRRIIIHFDYTRVAQEHHDWLEGIKAKVGLGDLDPKCHWTFESIEKKTSKKLRNMLYMKIDERKEDGKEFLKIGDCLFLEKFNFERFLTAIEKGEVQIEFSARTHHNHGTAFRTWERFWPSIYDHTEPL